MTKLIFILLSICSFAFADNPDDDYDFSAAQTENVESLDYRNFKGTLEWRVERVNYQLEQRCDAKGDCTLITFRDKTKGWTANLTLGNGAGSGSSYYGGSTGTINVINGADLNVDDVVANLGIGYRNITCERSAIVDSAFEEAYLVLMNSMVTREYTIREDVEPGQVMMFKAFATVVGAMKNNGCGNSGGYGRH